MDWESNRYSDDECVAVFHRLFPGGFAGPDVFQEIAPEGWDHSPLLTTFHPSLQQAYEENVQMHRNIERAFGRKGEEPPKPEPTMEEVAMTYRDKPIEPEREAGELVGLCLWDIFSDNHEAMGPDGRVVDIGSFRGAGAFIAERLSGQAASRGYGYMDFFMGTIWIGGRADLTPVYRMIFRRMKEQGLDWVYHFPRLGLVDLSHLREAQEEQDQPEWQNYSPSEAFGKEQEEKERQEQLDTLRADLDRGYHEAVEEARKGPPPTTVQAYRSVYGRLPAGWPPE